MNTDGVRDLLTRGIAAAKVGEKPEAIRYLKWALRLDPTPEQRMRALYYLSQVIDDPLEKRRCLQEILTANPNDQSARRSLAILDGQLQPSQVVDPDRFKPQPPGTGSLPAQPGGNPAARSFTCPTCGGRMTFAPDGQSLTCEYCEVQNRLVQPAYSLPDEDRPQDFTIAMATAQGHATPAAPMQVKCHTCGAAFSIEAAALSAVCPYCGTSYALEAGLNRGQYSIEALIPFRLAREQTLEALRRHLLSQHLSGRIQILELRGFYQPAWLFSMLAPVSIRSKPSPANSRAYTTRLDDLLILASRNPPAAGQPGIGQEVLDGFDLAGLLPYNPAYLANWPAETYSLPLSDASLAARFLALERLRQPSQARQSGPVGQVSSMDLMIESFRLVLLPLWAVLYQHKDRPGAAFINGQNGKVH